MKDGEEDPHVSPDAAEMYDRNGNLQYRDVHLTIDYADPAYWLARPRRHLRAKYPVLQKEW